MKNPLYPGGGKLPTLRAVKQGVIHKAADDHRGEQNDPADQNHRQQADEISDFLTLHMVKNKLQRTHNKKKILTGRTAEPLPKVLQLVRRQQMAPKGSRRETLLPND